MYVAITPYQTHGDDDKEVEEIRRFLTARGFPDCAGFQGNVCMEGEWFSSWGFESEAEMERFLSEWEKGSPGAASGTRERLLLH